ncbi:MAG: hypothetical protein WCI27_01175 [Candidatus Omnitrophota bacterium]
MSNMWIMLPVTAFILALLYYRIKVSFAGWRFAALLAAVTLAVLAVLFIEIASPFSALSSLSVRLFWGGMILLFGLMAGWRLKRTGFRFSRLPPLGWMEWGALGLVAILFIINIGVAFIAPPNNWDSMTYHLPRVMHWAANGSVRFYPAFIERQLLYPPGAEYCLLHLHLLSGGDRWFNFLQLLSWIGVGISTSLIAGCLGAGRPGQLLAGVVAVTIPMAVLQSTSTQNDLFVSFWISAVIALGLLWRKRPAWSTIFAAAAALGMSMLVKGTFFVVIPFAVWMAICTRQRFFRHCLIFGFMILLLVGGHVFRVWTWQDHSLLSTEKSAPLMLRHDPAAIAVNGMCQMATGLMTPFFSADAFLVGVVARASFALGIDLRSPELFGSAFNGLVDPLLFYDEDYASAPVRMILVLILPVLLWWRKATPGGWGYYACWMAGWVLFFVIVSWQPWITRLHLPLIVLSAPLLGVIAGNSRRWLAVAGIPLFVFAFLTIGNHATRPLFGANRILIGAREHYYFMKKPECAPAFIRATAVIRSSGYKEIGLIEGSDSWEYPLWALTGYGAVKYRLLGLPGAVPQPPPRLLVTLDDHRNDIFQIEGGVFMKVWEEGEIQIFTRVR